MLICPECESEYKETVEICPDCGIKLIHKKERERKESKFKTWEIVFTTSNQFEAEIIKSNLENADIACVILNQRDRSFNLDGDLGIIKVLVPNEKVQEALTIIDIAEDFDDNLEDDNLEDDIPR